MKQRQNLALLQLGFEVAVSLSPPKNPFWPKDGNKMEPIPGLAESCFQQLDTGLYLTARQTFKMLSKAVNL